VMLGSFHYKSQSAIQQLIATPCDISNPSRVLQLQAFLFNHLIFTNTPHQYGTSGADC
jgi:hypothetical protein